MPGGSGFDEVKGENGKRKTARVVFRFPFSLGCFKKSRGDYEILPVFNSEFNIV